MLTLGFECRGARPSRDVASPEIALDIRVAAAPADVEVQCVLLGYQVRIEAAARRYAPAERAQLVHLFGRADASARPPSDLVWARGSVSLPAFVGTLDTALYLPCSFDFNVAATQYFESLADGSVPIVALFNGTMFYRDQRGAMTTQPIPWSSESRLAMPVSVWREVMDLHFPDKVALPLERDVFVRLQRFRADQGLVSWEQALERLLP